MMLIADASGVIEYANAEFCAITGFSEADLIGRRIHELGQLGDDVQLDIWRTVSAGRQWRGEFNAHKKNGEDYWILSSITPIKDEDGTIGHFASVSLDVTDRKRAEESLSEGERRFQTLIEYSHDMISMQSADGVILYASPAVERQLGYCAEDIVGNVGLEFVHPDDQQRLLASLPELLSQPGGTARAECRVRHKDGSWRWIDAVATNLLHDPSIAAIVANHHDITDHKEAEAALSASEERFRALAGTTTAATFIFEGAFVVYANAAAEAVTGYSQDELVSRNFWEVLHPDVQGLAREYMAAAARGESLSPRAEVKIVTRGGEVRWLDMNVGSIDLGGKRLILATAFDVTQRKQAEEGLRTAEENYRLLYEDNPTMYFTVDREGQVLSVNRFGAEQLGYAPEELVGQSVLGVFHKEDQESVLEQLQLCLATPGQVAHWELRKVRKNGSVLWVKETARTSHDAEGKTIVLIVCEDITERRLVDAALQKTREQIERRAERRLKRGDPYAMTFRELTVLQLVAQGKGDKEIGATLGISPLTVNKHVGSILKRMGAGSRTEAGVRAVTEGLV